jgi:hypothetical protein
MANVCWYLTIFLVVFLKMLKDKIIMWIFSYHLFNSMSQDLQKGENKTEYLLEENTT